jgi:hypothetical protein
LDQFIKVLKILFVVLSRHRLNQKELNKAGLNGRSEIPRRDRAERQPAVTPIRSPLFGFGKNEQNKPAKMLTGGHDSSIR